MSRIGIRVLIGQHIALNRLEPHEVCLRACRPLLRCADVCGSLCRTTVGLDNRSLTVTSPLTRGNIAFAVGIICTRTNVHQIAREAIENATYVCEEHYGLFKGPPVQLICPKDLNFMYVPSHLVSPCFSPSSLELADCGVSQYSDRRTTFSSKFSRTRFAPSSRLTASIARITRRSR